MMDIILIAMIAVFILLRLRSTLGEKNGNEPLPPAAGRTPAGSAYDDKGPVIDQRADEATVVDLEGDPALRRTFMDIRRQDRSFDVGQFIGGAEKAYGMILEAFWAGDRNTLQSFLDDSVYNQFESAITSREKNELTLENRVVDVNNTKVISAELNNKIAELTVQFSAEIIAVTRDKSGKVVEGDVSDVVEMNDQWTFSKNVKSSDPKWTLVATRAG